MAEEKRQTKEEIIQTLENENEEISQMQNDITAVSNKMSFPDPSLHLVQALKNLKNCHFYFDAHKDLNTSKINILKKG